MKFKPYDLVATLGLLLVTLAHFQAISPYSGVGADEWPLLSLASEGLVACPHCNRFSPAYSVLGYWLWPETVWGFHLFHALAFWGVSVALYALGLRIFQGEKLLSFALASLYVVYFTRDVAKGEPIVYTMYSGTALALFAGIALFIESWLRRNLWLLGPAAILCYVAMRSLESTFPLLFLTPLILSLRAENRRRIYLLWAGVWYVALFLPSLQYGVSFLSVAPSTRYQQGIDLVPLAKAPYGMVQQVSEHFSGLLDLPIGPVARHFRVTAIVFVAFLSVMVILARTWRSGLSAKDLRARSVRALILGGVGLCAGVSVYVVVFGGDPYRAHFFSTPGAVSMIVGAAGWGVSFMPARWRWAPIMLLGAYVAVNGTVRAAENQRTQAWVQQADVLRQVTAAVPSTLPGTMIVLISRDGNRLFKEDFTFYFAVRYLYRGNAVGVTYRGVHFLFDLVHSDQGIHVLPEYWAEGPLVVPFATYTYDRVVFVTAGAGKGASIETTVPGELNIPSSARALYDPHRRVGPLPDGGRDRILAQTARGPGL